MTRHLLACMLALLGLAPAAPAQQPKLPVAVANPDFSTVESIMALIPPNVDVKQNGKLNRVAASLATDAIRAGAKGKVGQLKVKIGKAEPASAYGQKFVLHTETDHVVFRGDRYNYKVFLYFTADHGPELANLRPGTLLTVAGTFVRTDLAPPDKKDLLVLDLKNCEIIPASR